MRLTAAKSVTANFVALPFYTLSVAAGDGNVDIATPESSSICSGNCTVQLPFRTAVRLAAKAPAGKSFKGWSGTCRGRKSVCTLTLRSASSVTASFN